MSDMYTIFNFSLVIQSCELEFVFERGYHKGGGVCFCRRNKL